MLNIHFKEYLPTTTRVGVFIRSDLYNNVVGSDVFSHFDSLPKTMVRFTTIKNGDVLISNRVPLMK